jgi:hypothetical protein
MNRTAVWNEQPLGHGDLSIYVATSLVGTLAATPAPLFAAAQLGDRSCVLQPQQLGQFIRAHADCRWVGHDAGQLHWVLHEHFIRSADQDAVNLLWRLSSSNRLYDIGLLDQLLRFARAGDVRHTYSSLRDLIKLHCNTVVREDSELKQWLGSFARVPWSEIEPEAFDIVGQLACLMHRAFDTLAGRANRRVERREIGGKVTSRCGLLGLGIQVRAAIACQQAATHGLPLRPDARDDLDQTCESVIAVKSQLLLKDPEARRCFKVNDNDGSIKLAPNGLPDFRNRTLEKWLEDRLGQVQGIDEHFLLPPLTERGRPSTNPTDWNWLAIGDPLLEAWADFSAASELRQELRHHQQPVLYPTYGILPFITSQQPNLEAIRRFASQDVFEPAPGRKLAALTFPDLELRSLAVVCERRFGQSKLADLLRDGEDPLDYAGDRLRAEPANVRPGAVTPAPADRGGWRQVAAALLFAIPTAFGESVIARIARSQFGVEMTVEATEALFSFLTDDVFPELGKYLADDTAAAIAANLGITIEEFMERYKTVFVDFVPILFRRDLRKFGKVFGRQEHYRYGILRDSNRYTDLDEMLSKDEFSAELYRKLLGSDVVTPAGRVFGQLLFGEARAMAVLSLADDAVKMAAYEVVAGGFRLAGLSGQILALDVPAEFDLPAQDIKRLAITGASKVVSDVPLRCDVTIQGEA